MNIVATNSGFTSKLSAFASMVEGTSLFLIRQIDQTVDALTADTKASEALVSASKVLASELKARTPRVGEYLDPEDVILNGLKRSYESIEALLPKMLVMKQAIDRDDRLEEHHCEILHDAYRDAINSYALTIEAVKDLCAAIITHDLAAEPRDSEDFNRCDDLISALRISA